MWPRDNRCRSFGEVPSADTVLPAACMSDRWISRVPGVSIVSEEAPACMSIRD